MTTPGHKVLLEKLTIGGFLAALALPCIDRVLRPEVAHSASVENRAPNARPALSADLATLQSFPSDCERWLADTMGMRDRLLRWRNALVLLGFESSPSAEIVAGEDGWLYYAGDRSVEIWRGQAPMSFEDLESWRKSLELRRDYSRVIGARFLFVVAPNKETIYPEHLPHGFERHGRTRFDQVLEHLHAHSDVEVLDLRDALSAERASDRPGDFVYSPHGTHWTDRGGWVATGAMLEWMKRAGAGVRPLDRRDFDLVLAPTPSDDSWTRNLYLRGWLECPEWKLRAREPQARIPDPEERVWAANARTSYVDDPRLPNVFLVHDSFGPWVRDLLEERCSRLETYHGLAFPKHVIRAARPDFVIEMRTERCFSTPMVGWIEDAVAITPERFAELRPALVSDEAPLARATPQRNTVVRRSAEGAIEIEVGAGSGRIEFETGVPESEWTALRAEITSPAETDLSLWYVTREEPGFLHRNVMHCRVEAGRQEVRLLLPVTGIQRLMLQPGDAAGTYTVHPLEIRACRR
jgi:hypothetical protein